MTSSGEQRSDRKTKAQLLDKIDELRRRLSDLETGGNSPVTARLPARW